MEVQTRMMMTMSQMVVQSYKQDDVVYTPTTTVTDTYIDTTDKQS